MFRRGLLAVALIASGACGSSSPTAPKDPPPILVSFNGELKSLQTGAPIANATVTGTPLTSPAATNANGRFSVPGPVGIFDLSFAAPGFLTSRVRFNVINPTVWNVDAISLDPPFDLEFYREFARGRHDYGLQPIRRWISSPRIFFRTNTSDTGESVPGDSIDVMEQFARALVPQLTGGRFQTAGVERGPDPPTNRTGWIVVETFANGIPDAPGAGGYALVGVNPGVIKLQLNARRLSVQTGCYTAMGGAFYHEIVHSMGFYHAPGGWSVDNNCNEMLPHVLFHANVAYSRRLGNLDPDVDNAAGGTLPVAIAPIAIQ